MAFIGNGYMAKKKTYDGIDSESIRRTKSTFNAMISRCYRSSNGNFDRYGARGIRVADRWMIFENFLTDMGPRPEDKTIDRIDGTRGYEPGNCRWATDEEQRANMKYTKARLYELDGETFTVTQLAKKFGISRNSMKCRLSAGWSFEKIATTPERVTKRRSVRTA